MSSWSRATREQNEVEPFTVILSIGPPEPLISRADSTGSPERPEHDRTESPWLWQEAVTSLLRSIFARGGSVVARFDGELFPLLWATAASYAEPASAEHG